MTEEKVLPISKYLDKLTASKDKAGEKALTLKSKYWQGAYDALRAVYQDLTTASYTERIINCSRCKMWKKIPYTDYGSCEVWSRESFQGDYCSYACISGDGFKLIGQEDVLKGC